MTASTLSPLSSPLLATPPACSLPIAQERRINQVRSFYLLALVTLLVSALSMVWMNCTHWNSLISTVIFAVVVVHAVHTLRETSAEFQRSVALRWASYRSADLLN